MAFLDPSASAGIEAFAGAMLMAAAVSRCCRWRGSGVSAR